MYALGYVGRFISSRQAPDYTTWPYAAQFAIILASPVLLTSSMYLVMARIVVATDGEVQFPIKMKWFTKAFCGGDSSSLGMMGIGGALYTSSSDPTKGLGAFAKNIVYAGIGHHIIFMIVFMIVTAIFHFRITRNPTVRSSTTNSNWAQFLWLFYASCIVLIFRNVLRFIQFMQGADGTLNSKEIYLVAFDSIPVFLIMAVFSFRHPRLLNSNRGSVLLDEETSGNVYEMNK
ncbi:hypothetical protein SLS56_011501 [Neofusicoccum ribis]|uniref:Rta1 domain protein n=1 Tax=Neofusicoccum ribis TaxID=45134 RepID=A0ABR3SBE7_9PEZI